jgi:DtxR family manganese transport transcriptional regulator
MRRLSTPVVTNCGGCIGQFGSFPACKTADALEPLRPSKEHYIIAVYKFQKNNTGARITDIALEIGVSKPSAHTAMQELQRKNLVRGRRYGDVYLTEKGLLRALIIQCKYATVKRFLTDVAGVSEQTAAVDAGKIVHCISNETLEAFNRVLSSAPKGGRPSGTA